MTINPFKGATTDDLKGALTLKRITSALRRPSWRLWSIVLFIITGLIPLPIGGFILPEWVPFFAFYQSLFYAPTKGVTIVAGHIIVVIALAGIIVLLLGKGNGKTENDA